MQSQLLHIYVLASKKSNSKYFYLIFSEIHLEHPLRISRFAIQTGLALEKLVYLTLDLKS